MKARFGFHLSRWGGAIAVLGFPVSVSLSQLGAFLALVGWIWWEILRGRSGDETGADFVWPMELRVPFALKIAFAIYGFLFVSLFVNALRAEDFFRFFARGLRTEWKDVFLVPAALWAFAYTATPAGKKDFLRWLEGAIWIMLVGGFLAIFSEFRLANIPYHLVHGWETTAKARFQHIVTILPALPSIGRITLFMPVGFMNTHLTYAAQLSFVFPVLLYRVLDPFLLKIHPWPTKRFLKPLGMLLIATLILMLNNGRSALAGLALALLLSFYVSIRARWGYRVVRILPPIALVLLFAGGLYWGSAKVQAKVNDVVAPLVGEKSKHTDYQRNFLWKGVYSIVDENPVFGIGPGAFDEAIRKKTLEYSIESPALWYGYSVIQRGHAHNDLWHFLSIGGPLPALMYLLFFASLIFALLKDGNLSELHAWKWGALSILGGGLLQCYFQDDEVLLPFWLLVGFALRIAAKGDLRKSDEPVS